MVRSKVNFPDIGNSGLIPFFSAIVAAEPNKFGDTFDIQRTHDEVGTIAVGLISATDDPAECTGDFIVIGNIVEGGAITAVELIRQDLAGLQSGTSGGIIFKFDVPLLPQMAGKVESLVQVGSIGIPIVVAWLMQ